MAKLVKSMKAFRLLLSVYPDEERYEGLRGDFAELTKFLRDAPRDSPLRWAIPDDGHTGDLPRYRVTFLPGSVHRKPGYELEFAVPGDVDTDTFVKELREVFARNGWLGHG